MSRLGAAAITPRGLVDAALWSRVRAQYTMQFAHSQPQHQRDFCVAVARRVERYHYVSRAPMRIAALQRSSNAKEIAASLSESIDDVATANVQDDGTLTFTLRDAWLCNRVFQFASQRNGIPWIANSGGESGSPLRVLVDYASPNMAKELHVGHVRSAIIGHAISNTLELLGHDVQRVSHVGDFGTPIALVVARALSLRLPWALLEPNAEPPSVTALAELYRDAVAATNSDGFDSLVHRITAAIQASAAGVAADESLVGAWRAVCAASRGSFERIFSRLNVNPIERGESFYAPMLPAIVSELERNSLVRNDNGALVADVCGAPLIVRKSDGTFLYGTTDLAAVKHRAVDLNRQLVIYVVDASQKLHFEQVFELARAAQLYDPTLTRLEHTAFGMMLGDDGRKFSSRRGTGAPLEQLLDQARDSARAARASVRTTGAGDAPLGGNADDGEIDERLGVASVKFFDLLHERTKNYRLDLKRMLDLRASSAVYVMYAYARASAVLRREGMGKDDAFVDVQRAYDELRERTNLTEEERVLLVRLAQFDDVVLDVERMLTPHLICEFAFALAETFNTFYAVCRILDAPERRSRLLLCWATARTLRNALRVIGIEPLERL